MTAIPANAALTGGSVTEGGFKTALDQLLAALRERLDKYKLSTGTGTAYVVTNDSAIAAYDGGLIQVILLHTTNTGAVTLNIDGKGVKSVVKHQSAALDAGDWQTNAMALVTYDETNDRFVWVNAGRRRVSFSAHKNGTDQTGVVSATSTLITFGTEAWDIGGYYDAAASRFQPTVAGKYRVSAAIRWLAAGVVDGAAYNIRLVKNGVIIRDVRLMSYLTSDLVNMITDVVDMNGSSDYIEVFGYGGGAGNKSIAGDATHSWFCGEAI